MDCVLTVFVHPIDVDKHPSNPPGWRWCAQLGANPSDPSGWLNAGWQSAPTLAAFEGEMVGIAAAKALRLMGIQVKYQGAVELDHDPTPAGS